MSTEINSNIPSKEKNNEIIEELNMIEDLDENCDIEKLKEINVKSVDLIFEDKPQKSLDILKKLENFLENKVIDIKANINKKLLIIILHNIACCYQKLKDYDNCINYLEAVIYHFDKLIEQKHNIKINEEYFDYLIKTPNHKYNSDLLGDLILELRFCAKFHLQMGVALSESKRDIDSLKHIKLAALICEDNLIKTTYLYNQLKDSLLNNDDNNSDDNGEILSIKQQIKLNYKIIFELNKRIMNLRNNNFNNNKESNFKESKSKKNMKTIYNNNYMYIKNVITKIVKNSSSKSKIEFSSNYFKSYLNYRKTEIDNYLENNSTLNDIKNIFENNFNQKDDWIKLLNIDNIMYLSALNYDDLDLESDPKYELLRDSILEKVIMLSVSYFCVATELRHLSKDKNNKKTNGEYYLFNAINLTILFLPVSCPIIRHFILTYHKNYGQGMDIIPEGEVFDYKIEIIKKEIEQDSEGENGNKDNENKDKFIGQDFLYFARTQKINRIIKEENNNNNHNMSKKRKNKHNLNTESSDYYRSKSNSNRKELLSNDYFNNYYTSKKRRYKEPHKSIDEKNISNNHIIRSAHCKLNKKDIEILNISDNNLLSKKNIIIKDLNINYDKNNNFNLNSQTSSNLSLNSDIKDSNNKNANITNGHFGLIPNNNFIERVKKSKISDVKAPKFKLNFNNLNSNFYDSQNLSNNCNNTSSHIVKQISSDKKNKRYQDYENKNEVNSDRKRHISKINIMNKFTNKTSINIQFNHNCKANTKININISKIDKKIKNNTNNNNNNSINNNSKNNKFQIKKINNRNSGYKTERPHLKGVNNTSTQKKIVYKKNNKIQNMNINKKLTNKKYENSLYIDKGNNINSFSKISKYFNNKTSNIVEKEYLTDRFIVKINNKLKEKRNKFHRTAKCNSNSPSVHKNSNNNHIYRNYMRKKKKEKNPIKLVQNNLTKDDTTKYSALSDNQKNNQSNGNNSNLRNFYSNDSNIEDFSMGQKNIIKLKGVSQPEDKNNYKTRNDKDRINKYLKNINLLKKLMNNNNKSSVGDRTFNKDVSNQNKLQKPVKKVKFLPSNNIKTC